MPTGCLTMLALVGAFVCIIIVFVFSVMKSTDVYKQALAKAKADSRVVAALGSPITDGYFVMGKTETTGASGTADLSVPLSGPKGKGKLYFVASRFGGEWEFSKMVVEVESSGEKIDLKGAALSDE